MASSPTSNRAQRCPQCGSALSIVPQYVTWCEQCNWNINPVASPSPLTPFERLYAALSARLGQQLFDAVRRHIALRPPRTRSVVLATLCALGVHLLTLFFAVGGLALIGWAWPNPLAIVVGVLGVLLAWSGRPRMPQLPKGARPLTRQQAPTLFALLDQLSAALGSRPVAHVLVDERFNASYGEVGWRRAPVLTLGLPLVSVLDAQELIALLGHELAHGINSDPARGLVVGSAVQSLSHYYWLLLPPRHNAVHSSWGVSEGAGMANIAGWLAGGAMRLLALLPQAAMNGLSHLLWRASQRAEYYADRLAASAAGAGGMRGLLAKLHCHSTVDSVVQQAAVRGDVPDLFAAIRQRLSVLPERERERIRRAELQQGARLASTHPPTAFRIAMLGANPAPAPTVQLSDDARSAIDAELHPLRAPLQQRLVAHYLARLG